MSRPISSLRRQRWSRLPDLAGPLYGDKANSLIFDTRRIERLPDWRCEVSLVAAPRSGGSRKRASATDMRRMGRWMPWSTA